METRGGEDLKSLIVYACQWAPCVRLCVHAAAPKNYAAWLAYVRVANPGRPGLASAMHVFVFARFAVTWWQTLL